MQIGADLGALLALLARAIGARRAIEIGTFTGYSALAVAAALPDERRPGRVRRERRMDGDRPSVLGRGRQSPRASISGSVPRATRSRNCGASTAPAAFDLAFIDADKTSYDAYYEACLELLRAGGLIALDNMLWSGKVADPAATDDEHARATRAQREDRRRSARRHVPAHDRRRRDARAQALSRALALRRAGSSSR